MPSVFGGRPNGVLRAGVITWVAGSVALTLAGCGSEGRRVANRAPHLEITASPVDGDSVNYVVDVFWHTWDEDGAVVRSEYAVDIPSHFTREQIGDPTTPGIQWTTTTESRTRIRFRVSPPESVHAELGTYPTDRASAPHSVFVRCFDNEGAHSTVADRSFNAWTTLPRTTITEPNLHDFPPQRYYPVHRSLTVRWVGMDPDGRPPDYRAVAAEYKFIKIRSNLGVTDPNHIVHVDPGPAFPWVRVPEDSTVLSLTLDPPNTYLLALRSIDEAGGVESRFELGRNALLVTSANCPFTGWTRLKVEEPLLGSYWFPQDGQMVSLEIIAGQCLNFTMSGDATIGGGTIEGYRWCVDSAENPEWPGMLEGCVPWGTDRVAPPICFAMSGVRTVAFATRSVGPCGSGYTAGILRFTVLARDFHRDVLYVDDIRDPASDGETDRRFLGALRTAGFERIDSFAAWGEGDLNGVVETPTLSVLSRYKFVFWAVQGSGGVGQNGVTALTQASACIPGQVLKLYVAAGGGVWIHGETVFGAFKNPRGPFYWPCSGTTDYSPDTGLSFSPKEFVADYLHIVGGDFRSATTNTTTHGLLRAHPSARARAAGFPTLEADSTTYPYASLGGVPFYDAMFQPTFFSDGGLDTLYTVEPARPESGFNGKPIAWRYADPSDTPGQGPVAITSFPLQMMKQGEPSRVVDGVRVPGTGMAGLVEVLGMWFREHAAVRVQ